MNSVVHIGKQINSCFAGGRVPSDATRRARHVLHDGRPRDRQPRPRRHEQAARRGAPAARLGRRLRDATRGNPPAHDATAVRGSR